MPVNRRSELPLALEARSGKPLSVVLSLIWAGVSALLASPALAAGDPPAATALLDKLDAFHGGLSAGVPDPADAGRSLDALLADAGRARDNRVITSAFHDRYARVVRVVRVVVTGTPSDPLTADAQTEIRRFVKDILGRDSRAEDPVSQQIAAFAEAVATESTALRLLARGDGGRGAETGAAGVSEGGTIVPPRQIRDVRPIYPELAKTARIQGTVVLDVLVDSQGDVAEVTIVESNPLLDQAAANAARQWKYEPARLHGKPQPFRLTATVRFSLD